jgi:hypothetical protein
VKTQWFDLMVTGEKHTEFRKPTKFIIDRLIDKKTRQSKHYDFILFTAGYGYHLPWFICGYEGYGTGYANTFTFSDKSTIHVHSEDYNIFLGPIYKKKNLKR